MCAATWSSRARLGRRQRPSWRIDPFYIEFIRDQGLFHELGFNLTLVVADGVEVEQNHPRRHWFAHEHPGTSRGR